jgi:hypothetical protein
MQQKSKQEFKQGSASKCDDDGMLRSICSVHFLTYARCSLTVHAKHDVSVLTCMDAAGHGIRDLGRPRP